MPPAVPVNSKHTRFENGYKVPFDKLSKQFNMYIPLIKSFRHIGIASILLKTLVGLLKIIFMMSFL